MISLQRKTTMNQDIASLVVFLNRTQKKKKKKFPRYEKKEEEEDEGRVIYNVNPPVWRLLKKISQREFFQCKYYLFWY